MIDKIEIKNNLSRLKELIDIKLKFDKKYAAQYKLTCFIRPVNPAHLQMFFQCSTTRGGIGEGLIDNSMIKKYVDNFFDNDELTIYVIPAWQVLHLFDGTIENVWMPLEKFLVINSLEL